MKMSPTRIIKFRNYGASLPLQQPLDVDVHRLGFDCHALAVGFCQDPAV